ncbi:MAG: AAA family ATPase, partial [Ignavibacteriaceae bacterium]|nr:AAA family ATPase [Ignavibacteriaceae bacterium]
MAKKKIPYGVSNFEAIKADNYFYVDKTKYLEVLEGFNEKYLFFLRPRKFGKSLFISLLEYYYGVDHKDKFDDLFSEYYIGKNPTPKANSYYILKFDFSSIMTSSPEETYKGFRTKVIDGVSRCIYSYNLFTESAREYILNQETSNQILIIFLNIFKSKSLSNKIYILIDEYDHFTNELISFRLNEFSEIVSRNGY